jgi:hypothetical protein
LYCFQIVLGGRQIPPVGPLRVVLASVPGSCTAAAYTAVASHVHSRYYKLAKIAKDLASEEDSSTKKYVRLAPGDMYF